MSDERISGLGQVSLYVIDVDRAVAFYRDVLGLEHLSTYGDLAFFDVGGVRLYLQRIDAGDWVAGSILYLSTPEIGPAFEALRAGGVTIDREPQLTHTHPDGTEEWMAFFRDPEGNQLALMSRVPRSGAGASDVK